MQWFPDITTLLKDTGLAVALSLVFGYIIIRLLGVKITSLLRSHDSAVSKISALEESIHDPKDGTGKKVLTRAEIVTGLEQLCVKMNGISGDMKKRCDVAECPSLSKIVESLSDVIEYNRAVEQKLAAFLTQSEVSRAETKALIESIAEGTKENSYALLGLVKSILAREIESRD
jgi:hypothetical protein